MKVAMYHYVHPRNDNWLKGLKALGLKNFALQLDFFEKNFHILKPNSFIEEIAE